MACRVEGQVDDVQGAFGKWYADLTVVVPRNARAVDGHLMAHPVA